LAVVEPLLRDYAVGDVLFAAEVGGGRDSDEKSFRCLLEGLELRR
jgi:hypothetical protein